jgi:hypothetical protein
VSRRRNLRQGDYTKNNTVWLVRYQLEKERYRHKRQDVPARVSALRGRAATTLHRTRAPGLADTGACSAGLKLDGADVLVGIFRG